MTPVKNKIKRPTGKPPTSTQVRITRVETLDSQGNLLAPPEYEFWVVTQDNPPQVLSVHHTYSEAQQWSLDNNCELGM